MGKLQITAYGITKDILGSRQLTIDSSAATVGELRSWLNGAYPPLKNLNSLFIAINEEYADDHQPISEKDVIVLIPPVSGG